MKITQILIWAFTLASVVALGGSSLYCSSQALVTSGASAAV